MCICSFQFPNLSLVPNYTLVTISLFCTSVTLFLFLWISSDSTYRRYCMTLGWTKVCSGFSIISLGETQTNVLANPIFVFVWLTSFSMTISRFIHVAANDIMLFFFMAAWTGRPGVLWFMGSQGVGHDWATELNWTEHLCVCVCISHFFYPFTYRWTLRLLP